MALPTKGRVVIETTVGELDIELWSKETPKTCRNFMALAMEGYYDGVIFHRVVPGFLVQTGDKTGTGGGGESFYGEPFEDEFHPRLRYSHRGLVGMANNGAKDSNDSQFFITLDRADELHNKHTLFGRCIGDTIFNVLKIGELELNGDRPLYPPKIKTVRIIENPFDDIVPRITAAEKRAQQKAREQAQREREEEIRRKGAKKDTKLLSFQDEEEEEEPVVVKKKSVARPDLINNSAQLSVTLDPELVSTKKTKEKPRAPPDAERHAEEVKQKKMKESESIVGLREKHAKELSAQSERQQEISKLEKEIRKLDSKRMGEDSDSEDDSKRKKKAKHSYLDEELAKYDKGRGLKAKKSGSGKKVRNEDDIMAKLASFRTKLGTLSYDEPEEEPEVQENTTKGDEEMEPEGVEIDKDTDFLGHRLHFPKGNEEEVGKAERDYEVIDPRARSAQAKQDERDKKRHTKHKGGGRRSQRW